METHWDSIEKMKDLLLEKKSLNLNDIVGVLGPRPGISRTNFREYQAYAI